MPLMDIVALKLVLLGLIAAVLLKQSGLSSELLYCAFLLGLVLLLTHARSSLLVKLYGLYLIVVFVLPTVGRWIIGDVSEQYDSASYSDALEYVLYYNCVFVAVFLLISRSDSADFMVKRIGNHKAAYRVGLSVLFLSLLATSYLASTGNFRALDTASGGGRLLGLVTAFSELGILALFILGALKLQSRSILIHLTYIVAILLLAGLGALSGSRWYLAQVFLIVFFIQNSKGRLSGLIIIAVAVPIVAISFPLLGTYRSQFYDLDLAVGAVRNIDNLGFYVLDTLIADRMNYAKIVQRVIDSTQDRIGYLFGYLDNFIGLIPRVIWPDKPVIGMNLNQVAFEMGIVSASDFQTSIGLGVVGESYYQLKGYGLVVAIVQAMLFRIVETFQFSRDFFWRSAYVSFCLILVVKDSYAAIIPLFITHIVVLTMASHATRLLSGRRAVTQ
ncbi:hypothetical protein MALG_02572 [Marinovum algicola DG 898]|nr:hypothetical protein MALG_02572 [Marinovum algicola DG 898]